MKELDFMEYSSDANAQAAFVTNGGSTQDQTYSETNQDDSAGLRQGATTRVKLAQTIQAGISGNLTSLKFFLQRVGSPSGNVFATVYATSAGAPTGSALATSANVDVSTINNAAYALITFTFSSPYTVASGTTYAIVLEGDYAYSATDFIRLGGDWSSPGYTNGQIYHFDGTNWAAYTADACFYTYVTATQCYSENTIKTQGSYSLKTIATTGSLNDTLTRTVSPTIDLSGQTQIKFDIRSNRTGGNIRVSIHDSGGTTTSKDYTVLSANTFETVTWDISAVADADKNAIDSIIVTVLNADADNTFYIDNMYAKALYGQIIFIGDN